MSIDDGRKARRGRPPVNATPVQVRLAPEQLAALDRWIATQTPQPSRPEAIRQILAERLR